MTHQQLFGKSRFLSIPTRLGLALALLTALTGLAPLPAARAALIITVCTSGCDYTTIQAAINAAPASAIISVTDAVHTEAGITVNKSMTITGAGTSSTIVQAHANENQASNRVFTVSSGVTVTVRSMTIRHGKVTGDPAQGGGVYNNGTLTITNSTISGNTAQAGNGGTDYGGGDAFGGGIANGHHKTLSVTSSTISSNTVQGGDGWWDGYDGGDGNGGGIAQSSFGTGMLTFTNSTISGNTAQGGSGGTGGSDGTAYGGGIRGSNGMTLTNCTVASNQAWGDGPQGGGLYSSSAPGQGPVIKNGIFADNTGPPDANGPDIHRHVQSQDYNLIENPNGYTLVGSTGHNVTGQDPKLSALADNGGDTWTHALLGGSPAIDAVPVVSCALPTDQRGVSRPQGEGCDIGAYEAEEYNVYMPLVVR